MANMTPYEFMEKHGKGDPKEFEEFINRYREFMGKVAQDYLDGGNENMSREELSIAMGYDAFIKNYKKELDK
jgi:uncharacterized protein YeaO (DUF488 family)